MTIGQKIKKLRLEKELTQKDVADQLHVTFQTVSKWEKDEDEPDISSLRKLSRLFGCSMGHKTFVNSSLKYLPKYFLTSSP